jgi:AcrR family transcriptional regulator
MARKAPATTRHDLLEAAQSCFAAHGLDATKVEEITAQIGIAKGAFYSYFESKEECWRQVVEQFLTKLREAVDVHEAAVSGARTALPERLEVWLQHDLQVFEFCWDNRTMLNMLMNGSGGAAYSHLLDEFAHSCERNVEALVHELVAEHVYRDDIDPSLVACMLAGAYDRLVRELIRAPKRPDLANKVRQAQRLILFGLLTDRAKEQVAKTTKLPKTT